MFSLKSLHLILGIIFLTTSFSVFAEGETTIRCEFKRGELPSGNYSSRNQSFSEKQGGSQYNIESSDTLHNSQRNAYYYTPGVTTAKTTGTENVNSNSLAYQDSSRDSSQKNDNLTIYLGDIYKKEFPEVLFYYFSLTNNDRDLYFIEDEYNKIYLENANVSNTAIMLNLKDQEIVIDRMTGKGVLTFIKTTENGILQQSYIGSCDKSNFKQKF